MGPPPLPVQHGVRTQVEKSLQGGLAQTLVGRSSNGSTCFKRRTQNTRVSGSACELKNVQASSLLQLTCATVLRRAPQLAHLRVINLGGRKVCRLRSSSRPGSPGGASANSLLPIPCRRTVQQGRLRGSAQIWLSMEPRQGCVSIVTARHLNNQSHKRTTSTSCRSLRMFASQACCQGLATCGNLATHH